MKVLASMCVNYATKANLPAISYSARCRKLKNWRGGNTRELQAMFSLTYGLIRQLVELLPVQFSTNLTSPKTAFFLEGTSKSWTDAIDLLRDLVETVPKPLFCIVDGFQVLDDWSTESLIGDFVKVLIDSESKGVKRVKREKLKVLVTTTGKSKALVKHLDVRELVLADRDGAVDSPARRGGNTHLVL